MRFSSPEMDADCVEPPVRVRKASGDGGISSLKSCVSMFGFISAMKQAKIIFEAGKDLP